MLEEQPASEQAAQGDTVLRNVLLGVAAIYVVVSLFLLFSLRSRVQGLEQKQQTLEASDKELRDKLHLANKTISESVQALGSKVGMTQEEIERRTAELHRQQQQAEAKLTAEQRKTQQAVSQVSGDVTGVKTDLGGAKQDIASTRTDLEATKAKMEKAIGDLNIQSGLVARNHDELELLKHKGDRNYFEFTLQKSQRQPVSTISMQLKKTDPSGRSSRSTSSPMTALSRRRTAPPTNRFSFTRVAIAAFARLSSSRSTRIQCRAT